MRLVIAAILVVTVGCVTGPRPPAPADGTLTLRYAQTSVVADTRLSFTDVADSRCPREVVCAWAGDAAVRLEAGGESVVLHTNPTAGAAQGRLGDMTITLLDVQPEPVAPGETKKSDYVIVVRVSE